MDGLYPLFTAIIACILNLILTSIIIFLAHKKKWYDTVEARKIHQGEIPRLGGIGIFWTSFVPIVGLSLIAFLNPDQKTETAYIPLLGGMLVVHLLSLVDDFKRLSAKLRLAVQVLVSLALCWFGLRFHDIWIPGIGAWTLPVWLSWGLTVFWIVGLINAINMIDGMDGLCGGISIIAACAYGILYLIRGEPLPALFSFALVGALAGFLFYNFPPAKIFMGDSGSTYLGFMLAILPLISRDPGRFDLQLYLGVTPVAIPIFDTFAAIWRRLKARKPVMSPDDWHLHHKLLKLGLGGRSILAIVYVCSMGLGLVAISSESISRILFFILCLVSWAVLMALFFVLHFVKEWKIKIPKRDLTEIE
jgi:UDP-GlcNAc:undecaprenyl-phosphate GlcNAc-1-phosphate transferase